LRRYFTFLGNVKCASATVEVGTDMAKLKDRLGGSAVLG